MLLLVSLAKKFKTLSIVTVKTHHSAMKPNIISSLRYCDMDDIRVKDPQNRTEAWLANTQFSFPVRMTECVRA